jgi:succinate dehydrogenase/fumarate reductase flavoprotein subunit
MVGGKELKMAEEDLKKPLRRAEGEPTGQKWDAEADVVVVGFGGAGGAASIEAHDAGAEVMVLEKAPSNLPGGNTGCCAGYMLVPSTVSGGVDYYRALSFGTVTDEELILKMAKEIVEIPDWLRSLGAALFVEGRQMLGTFPTLPGSRVDQILVKGGGHVAFKILEENVRTRGIKVMYETPAERLIQDPSTMEILGVLSRKKNANIRVKARRGVVLACGGYQNNPEMLGNFNYPGLRFFHSGTPYNTGDGIMMAAAAGAKLWHMASFELMNYAIKAPSELFNCSASLQYHPMSGSYIFVNKYGKRFMPESRRMGHYKGDIEASTFDHDHAEYPNMPPYMIFDETFRKQGPLVPEQSLGPQTLTWMIVHKLYKWSEDNSREIEKGWIIRGDTIREVAENLRIDAKRLVETVEIFNTNCQKGFDPEFNRLPDSLSRIESPPFYGVELCLNIINTQGGPVHNARSQVIGVNNEPIPKLYAAGELGSFFGHLYQGGSNFPEALAFGRIAGRNAAMEVPWQ